MNLMFSHTTQRTTPPININQDGNPQQRVVRRRRPGNMIQNIAYKPHEQQPANANLKIGQDFNPATPAHEPKKMRWGEPTWFLLHTLAEKVKPESFPQIRQQLLQTIYTICTNLPCPDCASHAKTYLDGINFMTVQTRDELKNVIFVFHNNLNKQKGYPIFLREDLDAKYSSAVTNKIIYYFMTFFQDKYRSPKLMASDLQRSRISEQLKVWFNENIQYFN
jgi:hypothetical protein